MTMIENNGGPNVYVGKSTEPQPTVTDDGISEGALIIETDTKTVQIFDGENWGELVAFS